MTVESQQSKTRVDQLVLPLHLPATPLFGVDTVIEDRPIFD